MDASYITPAITLFRPDGSLDRDSQQAFYDNLIRCGIDGILVQGSIGEFFAMTMERRQELADFAAGAIAHRAKCIIGTASMVPDEIAPFSNRCLDRGADAVMVIPPYYFSLDQASLFHFFDRLLTEIHGPVYLYNFPDRTGYSIAPETVLELAAKHENLVGIKDTISGMDHTRELIKLVKSRFPYFEVYSGFDDNLAHNVLSGGNGCIGGISNFAPEVCAAWVRALRENDLTAAAAGQQKINRLMDIYSVGSLFVPIIKEAVRLRGITASNACTFPMTPPTEAQQSQILALLQREELLYSQHS